MEPEAGQRRSRAEVLDDFRDVSGWSAVASGQAQLAISRDDTPQGSAMRLDFDFKGGGGFVVARKAFRLALPASFAFAFRIRGQAPANRLELKLADPSGRNVWWYHKDAFAWPADWTPLRIRSREIEFAWGPAGGGAMRELAALEIALAAGPGGRGSVWISDLRFEDLTPQRPPIALASSAEPGHAPEFALDGSRATSWRSASPGAPQWFSLDFRTEREIGGLILDWEQGRGARRFEVCTSDDGAAWKGMHEAREASGERSYVFLPGCSARFLRLDLLEGSEQGFGITGLEVQPFDFSRSLDEFLQNVAAREPRGHFPRYLHREQSYWTPIAAEGGASAALMNEEGLLEVDRGSFSLEPFALAGGSLVSWADAELSQELASGWMPIPSSRWRCPGFDLITTAFADRGPLGSVLHARYRLQNTGAAPLPLSFFVALRPFQVTPPWQSWQGLGGAARVEELEWRDGAVWVDGARAVVPLTIPDGFGASAFEQGVVTRYLARGELPARQRVQDAFGQASGALRYELLLAPGAAREIHVAVPFGPQDAGRRDWSGLRAVPAAERLAAETQRWQRLLGRLEMRLPASAGGALEALRTAAAHILVNRDGPAIQPGPRRYTRSWIRDAATMSAALLRMGCRDEVRDFLRWYTPHQAADGNVPCCVDRNGPDWLVEHDSHGQLVFTIAEHFRFSGDRDFLAEMWPSVQRAVGYIDALRQKRLGPAFETPEKRACRGLLPESASHEGYLAHPVHAYWDDFWALRGLGDAVHLARALGDGAFASRVAVIRDSLHDCLYASIAATIAQRGIAYVPGSVEWADFDASATSTALTTTDAASQLPPGPLAYTYDEYLAGFRRRRSGEIEWNNYTPYEIRNIAALQRLGRRDAAWELLDFFLGDRRPLAWNQWPEIAWRDPRSPGHLGDVPHSWIGAEYVLALLGLFAVERAEDESLVLAAGIPDAWLEGGTEVGITGLATWYGKLDYRLRRRGDGALELALGAGLAPPPGGIRVCPPLARPLSAATVDGRPVRSFDAASVTLERSPATVVMFH